MPDNTIMPDQSALSDKTIIKPRPGGRGGVKLPGNDNKNDYAPLSPSNDKTHFLTHRGAADHQEISGLTTSDNPLIDEAGLLFFIITKIRNTHQYEDVKNLKRRCEALLKTYEQNLRRQRVDSRLVDSACYCMCSFIDEAVLNTAWGEQSEWGNESLLSLFYKETTGGESFYIQVKEALSLSHEKVNLLELQHLCLSLGFVGKMRVEVNGGEKKEAIREQVFRAIRAQRGDYERELSPGWMAGIERKQENQKRLPLWVFFALTSAILLMTYLFFNHKINQYSDGVYLQLSQLVPWQYGENSLLTQKVRTQSVLLKQLLQTEIQRGLLQVSDLPDRIRIRIPGDQLFATGHAGVKPAFLPVLSKIARSLESINGRILVTDYTDNVRFFSSKYPSNWHLSLARANAISDVLSNNAELHGRLWPEGKGEADPVVPNNSEKNRALNRRVDIDLLQ